MTELPEEYSHLYLAIEGRLAAVICIEDPLRPEARDVIKNLKKVGFQKIVMMTGDSDRTAKAIAAKVGVDEYYSEVLPEDKASFVEKEKAKGRKVIMIGDGINDSPALSAADVGIAIGDGAEIAREIADITIGADNLAGGCDSPEDQRRPDETDSRKLSLHRRLQRRPHRPGRGRRDHADDFRPASQYFHSGHRPEEHGKSEYLKTVRKKSRKDQVRKGFSGISLFTGP